MDLKPTRREALVTIAAAAAIPRALRGADSPAYAPQVFKGRQFELLRDLVEMIIPESDTPGAAKAGVHEIIDYDAKSDAKLRKTFTDGLQMIEKAGFRKMSGPRRVALLTEWSQSGDGRRAFFTELKNATIDIYYSTEAGLIEELGYKGNSYLVEFSGCQHEEHGHGE